MSRSAARYRARAAASLSLAFARRRHAPPPFARRTLIFSRWRPSSCEISIATPSVSSAISIALRIVLFWLCSRSFCMSIRSRCSAEARPESPTPPPPDISAARSALSRTVWSSRCARRARPRPPREPRQARATRNADRARAPLPPRARLLVPHLERAVIVLVVLHLRLRRLLRRRVLVRAHLELHLRDQVLHLPEQALGRLDRLGRAAVDRVRALLDVADLRDLRAHVRAQRVELVVVCASARGGASARARMRRGPASEARSPRSRARAHAHASKMSMSACVSCMYRGSAGSGRTQKRSMPAAAQIRPASSLLLISPHPHQIAARPTPR